MSSAEKAKQELEKMGGNGKKDHKKVWIWFVVTIIILGICFGLGYFIYKKFISKNGNGGGGKQIRKCKVGECCVESQSIDPLTMKLNNDPDCKTCVGAGVRRCPLKEDGKTYDPNGQITDCPISLPHGTGGHCIPVTEINGKYSTYCPGPGKQGYECVYNKDRTTTCLSGQEDHPCPEDNPFCYCGIWETCPLDSAVWFDTGTGQLVQNTIDKDSEPAYICNVTRGFLDCSKKHCTNKAYISPKPYKAACSKSCKVQKCMGGYNSGDPSKCPTFECLECIAQMVSSGDCADQGCDVNKDFNPEQCIACAKKNCQTLAIKNKHDASCLYDKCYDVCQGKSIDPYSCVKCAEDKCHMWSSIKQPCKDVDYASCKGNNYPGCPGIDCAICAMQNCYTECLEQPQGVGCMNCLQTLNSQGGCASYCSTVNAASNPMQVCGAFCLEDKSFCYVPPSGESKGKIITADDCDDAGGSDEKGAGWNDKCDDACDKPDNVWMPYPKVPLQCPSGVFSFSSNDVTGPDIFTHTCKGKTMCCDDYDPDKETCNTTAGVQVGTEESSLEYSCIYPPDK